MATVSDRVYSRLPDQPEEVVEAFALNQSAPDDFCTKYLEENVKNRNILAKNEHVLTYSQFILESNMASQKKLPKFHKERKTLTSRQRRKLQIHDVPKTGQKYSTYLKLHDLWVKYMHEVLRHERPTFDINSTESQEILLRADYHGCLVKVIQSKCPSYVGVIGLIMQDTKETFKIINKKNIVKVIPKKSCIFIFKVGGFEVKIYGNNFNFRPMDRINRKFKVAMKSLLL